MLLKNKFFFILLLLVIFSLQTSCIEDEDRKLIKQLIQTLENKEESTALFSNEDRDLIKKLIQILITRNTNQSSIENEDRTLIRELIQILREKWSNENERSSNSFDFEDRNLIEDLINVLEDNKENKPILCNENKDTIKTYIQKENSKKIPEWLDDVMYNIAFSVCAPTSKSIEVDFGQTFVDKEDFLTAKKNYQAYYSLSKANIQPGNCELIFGFCGGGGGSITKGRRVIPTRLRLNPEVSKSIGIAVQTLQETENLINLLKNNNSREAQEQVEKYRKMNKELAKKIRNAARNNVKINVLKHFSG